ncbi:LOW QUALITY PROTEIN: leucine-rich repeat-containing protein 66 [Erethizon dorsatum]
MKSIYFRVITIVIGLYWNNDKPIRKSSIFFSSECQRNDLLLTNCSAGKCEVPTDRSHTASVEVNVGVLRVRLQPHTKKEWKIKLDLRNNLISKMIFGPLSYLHTLEMLNLSNNAIHSMSLDLPSADSSGVGHNRSSFQRLPLLKLLILQRNKLSGSPEGLWKLILQSLDLSFNRILKIGLSDFHNCLQLENLNLKSNEIFRIHPEAFKFLKKLQILESFLYYVTYADEEARKGADAMEVQGQPPRGLRDIQDLRATGRSEGEPQDLALAVCLSVFITFVVAFCMGAFTRPYVDKLWRRCRDKRNKSRGSDNAYTNEGFYDGVEAAGSTQHPQADLRQAFHRPGLSENQDPFLAPEPIPYATVILDRNLGSNRKEPGSQQSSEQLRDNQRTGSRNYRVLSNGGTARSAPYRQPNADNSELSSAAQDHIYRNDIPKELDYEIVAPEYSLSERSMGISSADGTLRTVSTVSGSTRNDMTELDPSLSREMTASIPQMFTHTNALRAGESKEVGDPKQSPLETQGSQMELSKGTQVSHSTSFLGTQQQPGLLEASAEGQLPAFGNVVTRSDAGHMDPSALPPRWDSGLYATAEWPAQKDALSHPQYNMESDYDSDEGSLFTLSSEGSEGARDVIGDEIPGKEESCGATEPLQGENFVVYKDSVMPVESLEDNIPCQKIPGKYKTQEDHFEKLLISGPDSGLCKSHLESASNTNESENPLSWSRSLGHSHSSDEIPGMLIHDVVSQPEPVQWLYSLRDLEFSNADALPPRPPHSDGVPSDPGKRVCHERD